MQKNANASTLLFRLNYTTGTVNGWNGFAEFDQVIEAFSDNFNSGAGTSSPGRGVYPVVADPDGSDLNQLYFQYAPDDDLRVRIGRQRIVLDDQRYVGGVAWRQNEQTFDALSLKYSGFARTEVFYSYVANVNRIFGDEVAAGNNDQSSHLLNAKFDLSDAWKLVGYAYLIDSDDAPAISTNTFGLRATGNVVADDNLFTLHAEFATQVDAGDNTANFDTNYYRLEGNWSRKKWSAGLGLENLGSDNGQGYRTPLATLHLFNGWADLFLATPPAGLADAYFKVGYKPSVWNLQLAYHDFSADSGSEDFGTELDFSAARKLGDHYNLLLKLAQFDADSPTYTDTTKLWVMVTAAF